MAERTSRDRVLDVGTGVLLLFALAVGGTNLWNARVRPILDARPARIAEWESFAAVGQSMGPEAAPVTIVWFADYECPACRQVKPALAELLAEMGDTIRFVHRHWPLEYHARAYPAARAAECAGDQGMFWGFHEALFEDQGWLSGGDFGGLAERVSIPDLAGFSSCASDTAPVPRIEADVAAVMALGGTGTPTILVNDRLLRRIDPEHIREVVREAARDAK